MSNTPGVPRLDPGAVLLGALMAMFGWVTAKCAEHFTKRAEQRKPGLRGVTFLQQ
jgi:hypothetical protein